MKKAFLAAILAALLVPVQAQADSTVEVTIVGSTAAQGVTVAQCAGSGLGHATCQKTTVSRHARCAYLLDKNTAQSGGTGQLGFVFKIDPFKTLSYDSQTAISSGNITDGNNRLFNLVVLDWAAGAPVTPTSPVTVPDVDVVFYTSLGDCQGQPSDAAPTIGSNPTQPDSSSPFYPPGSYTGFGNETSKQFPSARYINDLNKPTASTQMWAIVTVIGGANTKVRFRCPDCPTGAITPA
ncbi:MAG: hypothetical protein ACLGH3_00195 [Actinomycetota bacterium]